MARKQLTEAQKAATEFTEKVDSNQAVKNSIDDIIAKIGVRLNLDARESVVALRDWAQLLIAQDQDAKHQATQDEIAALQKQLGRM